MENKKKNIENQFSQKIASNLEKVKIQNNLETNEKQISNKDEITNLINKLKEETKLLKSKNSNFVKEEKNQVLEENKNLEKIMNLEETKTLEKNEPVEEIFKRTKKNEKVVFLETMKPTQYQNKTDFKQDQNVSKPVESKFKQENEKQIPMETNVINNTDFEKKVAKKSHAKLISFLIILFLIAGIYGYGVYFFNSHYKFNTTVMGSDISLKSSDESLKKLSLDVKNLKLDVNLDNGKNLEVNYMNSGWSVSLDKELADIKAQNNPWLWFIPANKDYKLQNTQKFEQEVLIGEYKNKIIKLIDHVDISKAITYNEQENQYNINSSEFKNNYLLTSIFSKIKTAILDSKTSITIQKDAKPDESVINLVSKLNNLVKKDIPINFGSNKDTLDHVYIPQLIKFKDSTIEIDTDKLANTLQYMAKTHQRLEKNKVYSYNALKLLTQIKSDLENYEVNSYDAQESAIQLGKNKGSGTLNLPGFYIEVNITAQKMYIKNNSKLVKTFNVITGDHTKGRDTPLGVFDIWSKERNKTLLGSTVGVGNDYNYKIPVKYWMPIDDTGVGLHSIDPDEITGSHGRVNWNPNSYLTGAGSHGCVNMHTTDAGWVFDNMPVNTKVYVTP